MPRKTWIALLFMHSYKWLGLGHTAPLVLWSLGGVSHTRLTSALQMYQRRLMRLLSVSSQSSLHIRAFECCDSVNGARTSPRWHRGSLTGSSMGRHRRLLLRCLLHRRLLLSLAFQPSFSRLSYPTYAIATSRTYDSQTPSFAIPPNCD